MNKNEIKKNRMEYGLSRKQMAMLLEVSPHTIACWENGLSKPNGNNKLDLEALFGIKSDVNEIREHRLKLNLSQTEMAKKLGVSHSTLSRWENGVSKPRKNRYKEIMSL